MELGKEMQVYIERNYVCLGGFILAVLVELECLILYKYFLIYLMLPNSLFLTFAMILFFSVYSCKW